MCDISSPEADDQIEVTRRLLDELGCTGTPVVTALNKCDQLESMPAIMGSGTVLISARTGYGLNRLLEAMAKALPPSQLRMRLLLPYEKAALAAEIRESGKIFSEEYTPDWPFAGCAGKYADQLEIGRLSGRWLKAAGFDSFG